MATELFIWQPKAPKPERKRKREKGRGEEREGEGERERGGNCIIFSNQFRHLKQYHFLCNSPWRQSQSSTQLQGEETQILLFDGKCFKELADKTIG